jgi:hypothetical protein
MKTFLNVAGLLAMLSSPIGFFISQTPIGQVMGGLALLIGCVALGLAKQIELAEEHQTALVRFQIKELEILRSIANGQGAPSTPTAPAIPRWFVANGEEVTGPFTKSQISALKGKGMVTDKTMLAAEGTQDWQPMDRALE